MTGLQGAWGTADGAVGYTMYARLSTETAYSVSLDVGNVLTAWLPLPDGGDWLWTVVGYDAGHNEGAYGQEVAVTLPKGLRVIVR